MKRGDVVYYLQDPLLFCEMEVCNVRRDGRIVCKLDPTAEGPHAFEVFDPGELTTQAPRLMAA